MGDDGTVSCLFVADDLRYARAHQGRRSDYTFDVILHQVRHPLRVSRTAPVALGKEWWEWTSRFTGVGWDEEKLKEMAGGFWYRWNKLMGMQRPDLTYRIEEIDDAWPRIAELLGFDGMPLPEVQRNLGEKSSVEFPEPEWAEFGQWEGRVRDLAREYGYVVPEDDRG